MKKAYSVLFALHIFVGLGAVFGGLAAIINPQDPLGITVEALKYSPFSSFLIPGIILFAVIGLGNIISALMLYLKSGFHGYISCVFGWALVIWIVVQCTMLHAVVFLHVFYFIIGLAQAAMAIFILIAQRNNGRAKG